MPPEGDQHNEIKELIKENHKLLEQNQKLMRKLYRYTIAGIWIRIFWYIVLIGLPFALYFYVLEPYFEAFGSNYQTFLDGLNELPGLKGIKEIFGR